MTRLPVISGRECVAALEKVGFYFVRQKKSHKLLKRDDPTRYMIVPDHKELDRGTLCSIIRQTGLTVGEFVSQVYEVLR